MSMNKYINRILLAIAALFVGIGTANADNLDISGSVTNATVAFYKSASEPTAAPTSAVVTTVAPGEWIIIKVTPNSGYWTYEKMLTMQVAGSIGGAEGRTRSIMVSVNPTALSTNKADGTGYYYYQIPAECTNVNGYSKVIIGGEAVEKIDLSGATIDGTGKVVTATTGGWTATITLDKVSWTYDGSAHGPVISGFTLSNGTKTFAAPEVQADKDAQVSISGNSQTDAGNYTATLAAVANGCLKNSFSSVAFSIGKNTLTITAKPKTITYGDAPANDGVTYSGFIDGENENTTGIFGTSTLSYDYNYAQYDDVGTYTITPKGLTATNYDITFKTGTLTVQQKEVVLNWSNLSQTYSGSPLAPTCTATGLVNSDEIGVTVTIAGEHTAVGNYTATASALTGAKAGNYKLPTTGLTQNFSITSAASVLTLTPAVISSLTYDGSAQDLVSAGTATNGTVQYRLEDGTYSTSIPTGTTAGTYKVYYKVVGNTNYADVPEVGPITVTIAKKALTVTANDKTITYGEAPANSGVTYSGFVGTETEAVLSGTLSYSYNTKSDGTGNPYTNESPVGTYYIIPAGLTSTNYDITFAAGTLTVSKDMIKIGGDDDATATAKIVVDPTEFTYDGKDQKPTVKVVMKADNKEIPSTEYTVKYRKGSSDVTETKDAGTYTVVISNKAGSNYTFSGTMTADYVINPASLTLTANDKTIKYGEDAANDGVAYSGFVNGETAAVLSGTLSYSYNTKSDGTGNPYTNESPVGTYYIIPAGLTATNYDITFAAGTLTVNQKEIGLTWTPTPATFTYTGSAQAPTAEATGLVNSDAISITVAVSAKSGSSLTDGKAVNTGSYTATATGLTGDKAGNYKLPTTGLTQDFSITEATMTGIDATEWSGTYDGIAHGITVTAPAGATVKYRTAATGEYDLTTNPTFTNASETPYTVYYQVTKEGYTTVTGSQTVTITKRALTITAKDQSVNFGTAITQGTDLVTTTGLVVGQVLAAVTLTQSTTSVTTSGTITPSAATIKRGDNDVTANYTITYKPGTLIINASTAASAVVTANDRTYDGSTQPLVTIGTITNGATGTAADVVFYESATSTTPLTGIPQGTNASTYEVYYEVTPDADHTAPARAKVTVTISPIAAVVVTITGHNNTSVYDGTEHSVSGYDVTFSDVLYTEADFTFSGTATAKRTKTGMTTMGLDKSQFTNKNMNFTTVTFNVTDGYQTIISPDVVIVTITGHNSTVDYDGTEHSVSGYEVEISNPLYKETDFTFSGTAKAACTDAGKKMMGLDKSQFTNKNTNFGTVIFNVEDGYQAISPIAAAVTITGHYNTTTYDGTEHNVTGYDVTFSNVLYKETDFTFSGTAKAARTDEGTTNMGLAEDQFTNISPNFDPVTFTVVDGYQTITSVTDVVVTITGRNSTVDYDGTEHSVSGYDVEISNPLYKETYFTFSGTAVAALTNVGTKNMGLAPTQFANTNTDFSNVTFKVTDGYQTINPITATVTIKGHSNMAVYDGTEHSVTGYDVTFSNDLYKQTDFIFSGTAGAAQTYKGTAYMGLSEGQFANTSPNFSTVTFTVIDGYQTITPRPLTITANDQTIDYGSSIATGLGQVTAEGLQGSDKLTAVTLMTSTTEPTSDGTITPSDVVIKNGDKDVTGNYEISCTAGTLIIEYSMNLKAGYVTFCSPFDLLLPSTGVKAYTVSAVSVERGVVLTEQNAIGKNVSMILYVETAGTYKLRKADAQTFSSVPEFVGVTDAAGTDVTTIAGEIYILKDEKFVWSREGIVPQYRCYVVISSAAGARSLSIVVDGELSGIDNILWSDEEDGNWYSLDGRKLDGKPTAKGLYIMIPADGRSKGKKVMIK